MSQYLRSVWCVNITNDVDYIEVTNIHAALKTEPIEGSAHVLGYKGL